MKKKVFLFFFNEIFFCDSNFDDPLCADVSFFAPLDLVIEEMRIFFISTVAEAAFVRGFRLFLGTFSTWRDANQSVAPGTVRFVIFELSPGFVSTLAVDALNFVLMSLVQVNVERVAGVELFIA